MSGGKGIVLFSGGLDSLLTSKILMNQGIEVIGLHCILPFVHPDQDPAELKPSILAKQIGLRLVYYRCGREYLEMVNNPPHGYGRHMNPCVDCKIHFIKKAGELMKEENAHFVATGEVMGQRPMSQLKHMLNHIEKVTNLEGRLLRPLCAKLLKPTKPEAEGHVDRDRLYDISGRSRKRQMELVRELGIDKFASPAGGCHFTDPFLSRRVRDAVENKEGLDPVDYYLMTVGRHYRTAPGIKIIVSKNEKENHALEKYMARADYFFIPNFRGPHIYVKGHLKETDFMFIGKIMARHGKPLENGNDIDVYTSGILSGTIKAGDPVDDDTLNSIRI